MRARDYVFLDAPFLAFAHRGGARHPANLDRENSRHAFAEAVSLGYRYLETDVHATSDSILIAFHDDRLDRVTDQRGAIIETPYAAVQQALIGGHDPIPTLAELFEAFPDARFNIDAKSDRAVDLLARTIADHDAYDRVCFSSFRIRRLHRLRRLLGPRVASSASSLGIAVNRFVPWLAAVLDTPAPVLQLPVDEVIRGRRVQVLTPSLIRRVHRAGKQVHVWTIDEPAEMERLLELGVDGIFTDRIIELKDVLVRHGRWSEVAA